MSFTLRPYQHEAIGAVIEARKAGSQRLLVCLPTGAGKTVIFSRLAKLAKRPVLVLAHREELLSQAKDKIERSLDGQGLVSLEQGRKRASKKSKVVVASIRSLNAKRLKNLRANLDFGLIVYDECHHAAADDNMRVLTELGVFEQDWTGTLLGFTATTQRADGKGLDKIFDKIVFSLSIQEMIRDGYLTPLRGYRVATAEDLCEVTSGGRDFVVDELSEAIDIQERNALVARGIQELARDRRTLAFCVTVNHARNLTKALIHVGISANLVHGNMDSEKRAKVLADFRSGRYQVLSNVAVLTEGFDDPGVSCIAMARPTRSAGLYAQCVGRGTRLSPGKTDCLILDFVDVCELSLVTLPSLFGLPKDINLQGQEVEEAASNFQQWMIDNPGFEIEPGEITLTDLKRRVDQFDPLTLEIDTEVQAISPHAWFSLGRLGLGLLLIEKRDKVSEVLVVRDGRGRKSYKILWNDKAMAHFSRLEEAVEAVDYEVRRKPRKVSSTAYESADWRHEDISSRTLDELRALGRPWRARNRAQALQILTLDRVHKTKRRKKR